MASSSLNSLFLLWLAAEGVVAQLTDPFDTDLCPWDDFMQRANDVDAACCGDPAAGCPPGGGFPTGCSATCALTFIPFADQCRDLIGTLMPAQQPAIDTLSDRCITGKNEDFLRMVRDLQVRWTSSVLCACAGAHVCSVDVV